MNRKTIKYLNSEYREADMIIEFLTNSDDVHLSETQKRKLERYVEIHNLRKRYNTKKQVVAIIRKLYNVSEQCVYKDIINTEYIFGKTEKPSLDYERNFLIECSIKNIRIAFESNDSEIISKALLVHTKITGIDKEITEKPDFSKLQASITNINVPNEYLQLFQELIKNGTLNLNDYVKQVPILPAVSENDLKTDELTDDSE